MTADLTNADFDRLSWHDNALYGVRLESADPDAQDWRSDLILAIDHIVEWLCQPAGGARFRVAPATLTFHDVSDLSIAVDWGPVALHEMSIHDIERQAKAHPSGRSELPWYHWRIALNGPAGGSIAFDASGFTQRLLAAPEALAEQSFAPATRRKLLSIPGD